MKNKKKNIWNWICINTSFFIYFILLLFIITLSVVSTIYLDCSSYIPLPSKYKDAITALIALIVSFYLMFYGCFLGNENYRREKRIERINRYFADIKKCEKLIKKLKDKIVQELIYDFKNICDFMDYLIKNYEKSELDLFFIDKWKISRELFIKLNKTIESFKINYLGFKNSINNLKSLGLNEIKINEKIFILIKNFDNKKIINVLNRISRTETIKVELINLTPFLFPFIDNEIEALKANIEKLLIKIEYSKEESQKILSKCYNHKHYKRKKKHYLFCSTAIRNINKIIDLE